MDKYPRRTDEFICWAKRQPISVLIDTQLELLNTKADIEIQISDYEHKAPLEQLLVPDASWLQRAKTKLRMTDWRLQTTSVLTIKGAVAFQRAAQRLLDEDTYSTILEASYSDIQHTTPTRPS